MTFQPPPPLNPLAQLGPLLNLRNQQQGQEDRRRARENQEFQQAIKLIQAGAKDDVVLANTNLTPQKAALAREIGRVNKKQQADEQQAAQQGGIQRRAEQLAPGFAQRVSQGQPPGQANLQLLEQANQQFGPAFEQELRPLVASEQAKITDEEGVPKSEFERLSQKVDQIGFENLNPFEQKRIQKFTSQRSAFDGLVALGAFQNPRFLEEVQNHTVATNAIDDIDRIIDLMETDEEAFGFIGSIRGKVSESVRILGDILPAEKAQVTQEFVNSVSATALEDEDLGPKTRALFETVSGRTEAEVRDFIISMAYLRAKADNKRVTDADFNNAKELVGVRGFRSVETVKQSLKINRRRFERQRQGSEKLLQSVGDNPILAPFLGQILNQQDIGDELEFQLAPDDAAVDVDLTQ